MTATPITRIGFAVCPACQMSGHDGDSCRANALSDGRIECVNCGSFVSAFDYHKVPVSNLPRQIKTLIASMIRETYRDVPYIQLVQSQFGPSGEPSQAAAAVAQGNADVILNTGRLTFRADAHGLSTLSVRFDARELGDVPQDFGRSPAKPLDDESQQFLRNLSLHSCPPGLVAGVRKLLELGFVVRLTDFSGGSMRRILLHCGGGFTSAAGAKVPTGIMVEATYLV